MKPARLAGAAGSVAALGAAALALQWAGHGALAAPPLSDPGRWAGWLEARDPVVAAFGVLRVGALAGLWYLVLATLVGTILRLAGAVSLVRIADRFTVGPVRRMLAGGVSLGLAASGVVAVAAPTVRLPAAGAQTSTTAAPPTTAPPTTAPGTMAALAPPVPPATVTMHRLGPAEPVTPGAVPAAPGTAKAAAPTDRWTVKRGECFWSIAESVLAGRLGRPPTDAEIVPYWQRLIAANRLELLHRDNPDLIFPGQVFTIPAP